MRVDVYKNLRTGNYSVRHKGRVIDHAAEVWIDDAAFVVNAAGRARVLRERRKNVHAFVRGERSERSDAIVRPTALGVAVKYNPYEGNRFFEVGSGRAVIGARHVYIGPHGVVAYGLQYAIEAAVRPESEDRDIEFEIETLPAFVITDQEIAAISQRAAAFGDTDRVGLCRRALLQEHAARVECADILATEPDATVDPLADIPVLY